jgi:hypothetical protein
MNRYYGAIATLEADHSASSDGDLEQASAPMTVKNAFTPMFC